MTQSDDDEPRSFMGRAGIDDVTITAPVDISFVHPGFVAAGMGDSYYVTCPGGDAPDPDEYDVRGWDIEVTRDDEVVMNGVVGKYVYDQYPLVTYIVPKDTATGAGVR